MSEEKKPTNSAAEPARDGQALSQLFDAALEAFNKINKSDAPTNSSAIQTDIKRTMGMLEDATRLVSIVDMFSDNETFEEVATENIKFFLLPALLGTLTTKICSVENRTRLVEVAEIYFVDFLKRVKAYGLTDARIPEIEEQEEGAVSDRVLSNAERIARMVAKRNTKLERYREQKELQSRLEILEKQLSNENIDEETKRAYFVTLIKLYVNLTIEELASLAAEKPILEHMRRTGGTQSSARQPEKNRSSVPKLQPIVITRDAVQKQVYGAGYPSLPVMTVQEFYDKRVQDGDWPSPSERNKVNSKCLQDMANKDNGDEDDPEDIEKEGKIEADDPDTLNQLRAMDEYKDTHRRGWGNRANRS